MCLAGLVLVCVGFVVFASSGPAAAEDDVPETGTVKRSKPSYYLRQKFWEKDGGGYTWHYEWSRKPFQKWKYGCNRWWFNCKGVYYTPPMYYKYPEGRGWPSDRWKREQRLRSKVRYYMGDVQGVFTLNIKNPVKHTPITESLRPRCRITYKVQEKQFGDDGWQTVKTFTGLKQEDMPGWSYFIEGVELDGRVRVEASTEQRVDDWCWPALMDVKLVHWDLLPGLSIAYGILICMENAVENLQHKKAKRTGGNALISLGIAAVGGVLGFIVGLLGGPGGAIAGGITGAKIASAAAVAGGTLFMVQTVVDEFVDTYAVEHPGSDLLQELKDGKVRETLEEDLKGKKVDGTEVPWEIRRCARRKYYKRSAERIAAASVGTGKVHLRLLGVEIAGIRRRGMPVRAGTKLQIAQHFPDVAIG